MLCTGNCLACGKRDYAGVNVVKTWKKMNVPFFFLEQWSTLGFSGSMAENERSGKVNTTSLVAHTPPRFQRDAHIIRPSVHP